EAAIAIAEHPPPIDREQGVWERMGHPHLAINETPDPAAGADQKCAIVVLPEALDAIRHARQRVERWRTRFPSPHSSLSSDPERALAVLVQAEHHSPKTAVAAIAVDAAR